MKKIIGKSVCGGIAMGRLLFYKHNQPKIKRSYVKDAQEEILRFQNARGQAVAQLQALYEKTIAEVGEVNAMIFQIHQMMLEDLDYNESVVHIIKTQNVNAEYAVGITADNFAQMFSQMDDSYMKERAADVKDASEKLLNVLSNDHPSAFTVSEPVIIAADDLAPSETVQLDKNMILGFATVQGSSNSHTAILARTMNLPALIGLGDALNENMDQHDAILDGFEGCLIIDPDGETKGLYEKRKEEALEKARLLQQLKGKDSITQDGQKIDLFANIGNNNDTGNVLLNDAGGIGLFRSEFIYLEKEDYPTEEEQFAIYKDVAEKMSGKKVVIRTLDIGADKQIDYFKLPTETNPAMGYRAIRICLDRPDIFKTQLRALYRASAFGTIAIMFPMITSVEEVRQIKKICDQVRRELSAEHIAFSPQVELGIMIETPASVLISDLLAKEVDFFSIGTNDLTQYTLAVDRQNQAIEKTYDPHHLALLRMIFLVTKHAHENGIWVGICGELAADLELTETFLAMGIDELSVSPPAVLPLRKKIRETNVSAIRDSLLRQMEL